MTAAPAHPQRFIAFFSNETALMKCRVLRPGFRHCAVAVETPHGWTLINPRRAGLIRQPLTQSNPRDIIAALAATFPRAIVGTRQQHDKDHDAPNPTTCVGVCKRFIGLDAPRTRTPHQLFRKLSRAAKRPRAAA